MGLWGFDQIISGSVAQKEDLAECAHCGTKIKRVDNIIAGADGETWKIRAAPDYDKSSDWLMAIAEYCSWYCKRQGPAKPKPLVNAA